MKTRMALAALLFFLFATPAVAHRLDEYLQASTFAVGKDRVTLEMRLTPGVKVARSVIAAIDTDGDGVLSDSEQRTYEACVRRDLRLTIDGGAVPLRLKSAVFPAVAAMKGGTGEITLRFEASSLSLGASHRLTFENHHQGKIGVYLVNCLFPSDPDIRVIAQQRNYRQSFYQLDYAVVPAVRLSAPRAGSWASLWPWLAANAVFLLGALVFLRHRKRQGAPAIMPSVRSGPFIVAAFGALILCSRTAAHPLSQGALTVRVGDRSLAVHARVTVEEVTITNKATDLPVMPVELSPGRSSASGTAAFERHAAYLAAHLQIIADSVTLAGRVVRVHPPTDPALAAMAEYDLDYPLPRGFHPKKVTLYDHVLNDGHFAPGAGWETTYVVDLQIAGGSAGMGFLLTRAEPLRFDCTPRTGRDQTSPGGVFGAYFFHGVHHILTGYDHLLFISALVLAAVTLWDLVKVVTAFTLAHTLTLTLASLNLVHLSGQVVEPLISASIVFVAVQNTFWPNLARGGSRLAAAFFFGLFHGLGFAGGLLDAMREMTGGVMIAALLAFSLGVEVGHQLVVLPLFTLLKATCQVQADPARRERWRLKIQRIGSAAISVAGLYYFYLALAP